ncbi:MAG: hypothetical protein PHV39_01940 [Methanomicrobium sp.]|nr:hypothetical protein [Methanomicrobium sp.]
MDKAESAGKGTCIISIFEKEIKAIQDEINKLESGGAENIAVISEPYSGIEHIFDKILGDNSQKINNLKLFNPVKETDYFSNFYRGNKIILMHNCQYLYTRKCGGFDIINYFMDAVSSEDRLFITGWNKFAWNYLKEVCDIENLFGVRITVPELDSKSIMSLIMTDANEKINFIDDRAKEEKKFICVDECSIKRPMSQNERSICKLRFNFDALKREKNNKTMEDIQTEAFQKITKLAGGKYDVARLIWKKTLKDNELRLSRIPETPPAGISGIDESFILSVILSMDTVSYENLLEIVGEGVNLRQKLQSLKNSGLIEITDNSCRINPEAVNAVIYDLKKRRMVW